MTKILRMKNTLLFALCMIIPIGAEAQRADLHRWIPDWGAELVTEQQVTNEGGYNCANLLRLQASLPIARGFSLDVGSISTCMTAAESIGGDLQTFSNLDAGNIPFALSVCNLVLNIGERHSLSLGIRNMNEDYFCSDVTSLFTNSSCGIYPTISANYPIVNYPVASVGLHYQYRPSKSPLKGDLGQWSVQASLYNGTGYNRFTGRENVFRVCPKSDGVFGLAQIEYDHCGSSYFLGNSVYYNMGTSLTPWFYAEQKITPSLSILAGYSHAFAPEAECKDFVGLGLYYQRKKCELGAHSDYAHFVNANEFATELTFKYTATEHLYLQPVLHVISTSSEDSSFRNNGHVVASIRIGMSL